MKKLLWTVIAALFLVISNNVFGFAEGEETTEAVLWDGLDSTGQWAIVKWGDEGKLSLSAVQKTEGDNAFRIDFGPEGKQTPSKGIVLEKEQTAIDIDSTTKIILDVYNDGLPFELAMVIYTDEFCESSTETIKTGLNKDVTFDLRAKDFKSPTSGWRYNYSLRPGTIAWRIMFIIYPDDVNDKGSVYFDNIRTERTPRVTSVQNIIPLKDYLPPKVISVKAEQEKIEQYEKFEATVDFEGTYQYPYDPENIDLTAVFTAPSGKKFTIPGFLYSGKVDGVNISDAVWKVRFAPPVAGKWYYYVTVNNPKGLANSELLSFECQPAAKKGFVRISKKDPLYLEFESGEFYYPIGQNVAWAPSVEAFERYFSKMQENKYNWSRVWMSSWQCAIEWLDVGDFHGLNNYNLKNAQLLDDINDAAKQHDIYYQLVLNQHGQLSTKVDPEWLNNPYNAKNGGPCTKPAEFFTNEDAKELFKYRVRYIVARWGYSTNILAWELWNELTLSDDYDPKLDIPWQKEMARYINTIDPYRHLITTSYFGSFPKDIWKVPEINYGQIHMYTPEIVTTLDGLYEIMKDYRKPYFVGEFGGSNLSGIDKQDPNATVHHSGIWAAYTTASSGDAMPWEWDSFIDPNNLYFHWLSLAKFNEGEDRRNQDYAYSRGTIETSDGTILMAQGVLNRKRALIWIYDLYRTKFNQGPLKPLDVKGAAMTLYDMADGAYKVEFWDTYKGTITGTLQAECVDAELKIPLPEVKTDIACKVISLNPKISAKSRCRPYIDSNILEKDVALLPRNTWTSFETKKGWDAADWGDKVKVSVSSDNVTEGKKSLKITFDKKGRRTDGKGIAIRKGDAALDLSKAKKILFDVYLEAPNSIEVSVVLNSAGFCESTRKILLPGRNKNMTFDLTARTFKKESTRWQHKGEIDRDKPMQEVLFMFYPWDVESGSIYVDNVGFLDN